jgi:hypothetical protein
MSIGNIGLHHVVGVRVEKDKVIGEKNPSTAFFVTRIYVDLSDGKVFDIVLYNKDAQSPLSVVVEKAGGPDES